MIGNKIADKIAKASPQNISGTVESEKENTKFDKKEERYVSLKFKISMTRPGKYHENNKIS